MPRSTGIENCVSRIYSEQGAAAFWRVNFTNCIRCFPTQAFNLSFKDSVKIMFPKCGPKQDFGMFFAVKMASDVWQQQGVLRSCILGTTPASALLWMWAREIRPSTVCSMFFELNGCWPRGLLFPLRWFWRVHRRNHPVPWLPARCLRHHRGTQPVEVRHRHVYFASTFAAAQTAMAYFGSRPFLAQTVHCSRVSRVLSIRLLRVFCILVGRGSSCRAKDGQRWRLRMVGSR